MIRLIGVVHLFVPIRVCHLDVVHLMAAHFFVVFYHTLIYIVLDWFCCFISNIFILKSCSKCNVIYETGPVKIKYESLMCVYVSSFYKLVLVREYQQCIYCLLQ